MRAYSMDLRERVLRDSDAGLTAAAVAVQYHVSASWVRRQEPGARATAREIRHPAGGRAQRGSTWSSGNSGSRRPPESGSHPDGPQLVMSLGRRRRGCNSLRAFARNRRETGSLGTARSATQSRRCSRSGIARGQPQVCPWILGAFSGRGRGAGETRGVRRGVASGVRAIVSRARFRGPGWERREPLPGHPVRVPPGTGSHRIIAR